MIDPQFVDSVCRWLWSDNEQDYEAYNMRCKILATEFECAISTVIRWSKGTASPHPLFREQVLKFTSSTNGVQSDTCNIKEHS